MAEVLVGISESSSDSITEIEPPKKIPPPLIDLELDDIILNVEGNTSQTVLAIDICKKDGTQVQSPEDNPKHWTQDMVQYYNDDWGDEDKFIVEKIQEGMDKCPSLWSVSDKDLYSFKNRKNKSYLKCWNCCEYGHVINDCKHPIRIIKCHMCGEPGHSENSCPNSICLNCGNQMGSFVLYCNKCAGESEKHCSRCSLLGHHFLNCSDNWRRFHLTVGKPDIIVPSKDANKSMKEMWCCNCGKKGHHQIHCFARKNLPFPDTFPFVASYDTSFNEKRPHHAKGANYHKKLLGKIHNRSKCDTKNQSNSHVQKNNEFKSKNSKIFNYPKKPKKHRSKESFIAERRYKKFLLKLQNSNLQKSKKQLTVSSEKHQG